jgi:hypothetical protein
LQREMHFAIMSCELNIMHFLNNMWYVIKVSFVVVLLFIFPQQSKAEDFYCAAVYPCQADGTIDPKYDIEGTCGDQYRSQCKSLQVDMSTAQLNSCMDEKSALQEKEGDLRTEIRKLKKKLRLAKKLRKNS